MCTTYANGQKKIHADSIKCFSKLRQQGYDSFTQKQSVYILFFLKFILREMQTGSITEKCYYDEFITYVISELQILWKVKQETHD